MKSFMIGCGIVAGILLLIIVGAGFWVGSKFRGVGKQIAAAQQQLATTNRQFPFTPPADGLLAEDRLTAWCKVASAHAAEVQNLMIDQGPGRMKDFKAATAVFTMMQQVGPSLTAQLIKGGMSIDEYRWTTGQLVGALNSGDARQDPALAPLVKMIDIAGGHAGGNQPGTPLALAQPVTSAQIQHVLGLLKRHQPEFEAAAKALPADAMALIMMENQGRRGHPGGPATGLNTGETTKTASPAAPDGLTTAPQH